MTLQKKSFRFMSENLIFQPEALNFFIPNCIQVTYIIYPQVQFIDQVNLVDLNYQTTSTVLQLLSGCVHSAITVP